MSETIQSGTREEKFSLPEGEVLLKWYAPLSNESYQDICAWLTIVQRKIGRCVKHQESDLNERCQPL